MPPPGPGWYAPIGLAPQTMLDPDWRGRFGSRPAARVGPRGSPGPRRAQRSARKVNPTPRWRRNWAGALTPWASGEGVLSLAAWTACWMSPGPEPHARGPTLRL